VAPFVGPTEPGRLLDASLTLAESAAAAAFRGPDPYDGLWHPWPRALVASRTQRQLLIQLHARSPVDFRRLYRRQHPLLTKALGIFGSVGARLNRLTGAERPREIAVEALDLLPAATAPGSSAWGYPWDMQTRWSFYPAGSPNIVVTAFAISGLLEAAAVTGRPDFRDRARQAGAWALRELWREPDGYFAYHPGRPVNIHNANLLGAWLVTAALGDDPRVRRRVARAVDRTLAAQRSDGSWPYGEGHGLEWADSFHSGYVLTFLDRLRSVDDRVDAAVARGAQHYRGFFDASGRSKLWTDRPFPEDAHSAGTGLTTLATLMRRGVVERETLERVAARTVDVMLSDGHAVHRRYRWGATRVTYVRWCDAHVALGLVDAAAALGGWEDAAPLPGAATRSATE
jgi:hypothetical protein